MLSNLQKRIVLFLTLCIGSRVALVILAKQASSAILWGMGAVAACVSVGFMAIFLFKLRETGAETYGEKIWWNALRPFHAATYGLFAYLALTKQSELAWKVLLVDVLVGLGAFLTKHFVL
jgi:hypothetical protein